MTRRVRGPAALPRIPSLRLKHLDPLSDAPTTPLPLTCIIPFSFLPGVYYATAYWMPTEKRIQVKNVLDRNGDAYGFYNNSVKTTGWGILEIKAGYGSQSLSNEIIMFAAGFLEGYLTAPAVFVFPQPITLFQIQFLNAIGDLLDLIPSLSPTKNSSLKFFKRWDMGHCSALIKVRFMESLDDFYLLSSGLVLLQTTNSVYNKSLLQHVVPQSLLAWQRVRVANMMANNGKQWAEVFSKFNSGTYNNQYMVLDLKKVNLNHSLDEGTLYIVEQIPTYVEYSEQTAVLRRGYWPSYNIPFHEKVYNWSGYPILVKNLGLDYSYDLAPRAKIFRRDQGKVTDMESMKYIMRYNNYKEDPYSKGDPCNTICCREDLNSLNPSPGGCYDTKVADIYLASKYKAYAISGPTVQGGLPVFHWSRFNKTLHEGMPEAYNFDFITMKPIL
ncbi:hypothetical protein FD755_003342 [Muntiacus reevesi]|uniref:Phospholipase B-like n=1 Tax=Muntiacus reevesi TaxID=9886 RepID=A0A5J5N770_MUNRE|nr:hypothetical protein FD755_003342 [Muntiacus reevesi]